jgi:hypothetical protein
MGSGTSWNEDRKHFQGRKILTYRVTTSWPFFSSIAVTVVNARAQAGEGFTTPLCKHKYEVVYSLEIFLTIIPQNTPPDRAIFRKFDISPRNSQNLYYH